MCTQGEQENRGRRAELHRYSSLIICKPRNNPAHTVVHMITCTKSNETTQVGSCKTRTYGESFANMSSASKPRQQRSALIRKCIIFVANRGEQLHLRPKAVLGMNIRMRFWSGRSCQAPGKSRQRSRGIGWTHGSIHPSVCGLLACFSSTHTTYAPYTFSCHSTDR